MNIVAEFNRHAIQRDARGRMICRFFQRGACRFGNRCRNSHGEAVTVSVVSPKQQNQNGNGVRPRNDTRNQTASALDSTASLSTALTSSVTNTKSCGICLEVVTEKSNVSERTFGILAECNHCFCFVCIQEWRRNKEVAADASKSCPECRTSASYVYRSRVWFDDKQEKDSFIAKHKDRMQKIDCRYFKKGKGRCRLGNTCMYRHVLANGIKVDLGAPNLSSHGGDIWFDDLFDNLTDSDNDDFAFEVEDRYYDSDPSYASDLGMYYEDNRDYGFGPFDD